MKELKLLWEQLVELVKTQYNGKVTISFKCGKIQPILEKTKETIKIY